METIFLIGLAIAVYFLVLTGLASGAVASITPTPTPSLDDQNSSMLDDDSFTLSTCSWCGSLFCTGICDHDSASSTSMFDDSISSHHSLFDDHCGISSSMFDD